MSDCVFTRLSSILLVVCAICSTGWVSVLIALVVYGRTFEGGNVFS